jgi:hypothetical protein
MLWRTDHRCLGALGFDDVRGLAFDRGTSRLYGVDFATRQLIAIDTFTGAGTAVGSTGFAISGLGEADR